MGTAAPPSLGCTGRDRQMLRFSSVGTTWVPTAKSQSVPPKEGSSETLEGIGDFPPGPLLWPPQEGVSGPLTQRCSKNPGVPGAFPR